MKIRRALPCWAAATTVAALVAFLALAGSAQAATVTVGGALTGAAKSGICGSATGCGLVTVGAEAPSSAAMSPFDGTVTRWRIVGANEAHGFSVNVLRKNPDGTYTVTASSAEVTPPSGGEAIDTFPTSVPIHAGEYIELNVPEGGYFGVFERPSTFAGFIPPLMPGETRAPGGGAGSGEGPLPVTLGYNADIEYVVPPAVIPAPVLLPTPPAPPVAEAHCVVPKLQGKRLRAAKKKIRAAGCRVGLVSKESDVGAQSSKVVKQSPKPGKVLPLRTGVSLKLG